jgi:hypothetical protein
VPVAANLAELNRKRLEDYRADENPIVSGQATCVGTRGLTGKEHLLRKRSSQKQEQHRQPIDTSPYSVETSRTRALFRCKLWTNAVSSVSDPTPLRPNTRQDKQLGVHCRSCLDRSRTHRRSSRSQ